MPTPRQTGDGSFTLYNERYQQTYHSIHGSRTESEHVFLQGTGIARHIALQKPARVLEVGFGTGLNFLLTGDLALRHRTRLSYWAFERELPPLVQLAALRYDTLLTHGDLFPALLNWLQSLHDLHQTGLLTWTFSDRLTLHLISGDATKAPAPDKPVDAIFLDAFSPDKNPELWTVPFFKKLYGTLRPGGALATYSARSLVRKNLTAAGFEVSKHPGPPGKREMLSGQKPVPGQ